jgi:hypothetical protein
MEVVNGNSVSSANAIVTVTIPITASAAQKMQAEFRGLVRRSLSQYYIDKTCYRSSDH